ncbi:MAG: hypothetical protein C0501_16015 [Isosphaera sp.]|nr:hypothetical protein [Isosphaera sp.]
MTNPLDPIVTWYTTAKDSMRVTRRAVQKATPGLVAAKYTFHGRDRKANESALDQALEELNRLVVLALTAVFERTLRDHLSALPVVRPGSGDPLADRVRDEVLRDMEFWNISTRVVEVFTTVAPALRGEVKQVIDYRNWVAHGRTAVEPPPVAMTPAKAYQRLTAFLTQAKVI